MRIGTAMGALLALLSVVAAARPAVAERRVALVVGNGAYQNVGRLANAPRDGESMAALLARLDFEVELLRDLGQRDLAQALRRFSRRADGADVALFFYAGHSVQANDVNYLLPVDGNPERAEDLRFDGIDLGQVLGVMQGARARLIFLDACRNNPLADRLAARSRGVSRGLARVDTSDVGTLIAFATSPGATAEDGAGANSPFTQALLEHLATPGLEVRGALTRVRNQVMAATGDRQVPWENSSLRSEIYLAVLPAPQSLPAPPAAAPGRDTVELRFWESAERGNTPADYQAYLRRYPEGSFAELARIRMVALDLARVAASLAPAAAPALPADAAALPVPPAAAGQVPAAPTPSAPPTVVAAAPAATAVAAIDRTLVMLRPTVVRGGAGDTAPRIGQLAADAATRATGRAQIGAQTWYRISYQASEGWIAGAAAREIEPAELAAWTQVRDSRDEAALEDFVRSYPRGHYVERARQRLQGLHGALPANAAPGAVVPPAARAPTQAAARASQPAAVPGGCFRLPRAGGQYVRLCLTGTGGTRQETIAVSWGGGSLSGGGGWDQNRRELCTAPLVVADLAGQVRLSWAASTCGQATASAGSTTCSAGGDGGALTCGGDVYRRE
jgi:uncharacterized caspase-like protein